MLQGTQWQSHGTGDLGTMANHNSTSLLHTLEHEKCLCMDILLPPL